MSTAPAVTQRGPELSGQTVVLIGGSAGIGLETARLARAEGAGVILAGRGPERLDPGRWWSTTRARARSAATSSCGTSSSGVSPG